MSGSKKYGIGFAIVLALSCCAVGADDGSDANASIIGKSRQENAVFNRFGKGKPISTSSEAPVHDLPIGHSSAANDPHDATFYFSDREGAPQITFPTRFFIRPANFLQPEVVPEPVIRTPIPSPQAESTLRPTAGFRAAFGRTFTDRTQLSQGRRRLLFGPSIDIIGGGEARVLPVSFTGSLLGKSTSASGVRSIKRSPIVSDTRVRGKRVGQTLASGSFWVPARMDLDSMLSKIDARLIEDVVIIKGPYSAMYGPGLDYLDLQLLRSPRYAAGPERYGSTSVDYQANNEHWYGRQSVWGGSEDWGFHVGYGHRTGNDYTSGDGTGIPASFKARDLYLAMGYDLDANQQLEFNFLRLDETDVEFPGQAFDMDFLVTDGFEVQYVAQNLCCFDRTTLDVWYNRTRFEGGAQRAGKRRQFPVYDTINFEGDTDVDSMSTGFRYAATWQTTTKDQIVAGADFRFLKQELNEITTADFSRIDFWQDANSPIPRSHWSNPGLFAEWTWDVSDCLKVRSGARVDWVSTNLEADASELSAVGGFPPGSQPSYAEIVGSDEFDRDFAMWAAYLSSEYELNERWTLLSSGGQAQRAPTMTELYASEPFMFLLQNGLNTVTGNPRLDVERAWQVDVGLQYRDECTSFAVNGFHAWVFDYITYENMAVQSVSGTPEQVQLKFVNTDLATLAGVECNAECELTGCITLFGTLSYIAGRDHSRNGDFATRPANGSGMPSVQVPGLARGTFSGVGGATAEPLPSILPLDGRMGMRLHPYELEPTWTLELSVRIADDQNRIATSLFERPTPGFAVWDMRGFWQVSNALLIVAGVENFGDRNYREHLDYRPIIAGTSLPVFQPGANFYFGGELTY